MNSVCKENLYSEINSWNLGAMLCPFLWGLGNKIDWPLNALALISLCNPLTALLVCVWFGMNGNKWALENNDFKNIEIFKTVQKRWATGIITIYAVAYLVFAAIYLM